MRTIRVLAPAKVNLTLHVLSRRSDGFHDLHSLMAPIDLADRLSIRFGGEGVRLTVPGHPALEGAENLCTRAWEEFQRHVCQSPGLEIVLDKQIPIAAGLGGGSSDAAAILRVLATAQGVELDDPRLVEAALAVGSDVPFFLQARPAVATGRGERLHPFDLPALPLVLIHLPYPVSAKDAYERLSTRRSPGQEQAAPRLPAVEGPADAAALLHNDLQAAILEALPLADPLTRLREAGALGVLMSGSGPTVFGVFSSTEAAAHGAQALMGRPEERVWPVTTLGAGATLVTP